MIPPNAPTSSLSYVIAFVRSCNEDETKEIETDTGIGQESQGRIPALTFSPYEILDESLQEQEGKVGRWVVERN